MELPEPTYEAIELFVAVKQSLDRLQQTHAALGFFANRFKVAAEKRLGGRPTWRRYGGAAKSFSDAQNEIRWAAAIVAADFNMLHRVENPFGADGARFSEEAQRQARGNEEQEEELLRQLTNHVSPETIANHAMSAAAPPGDKPPTSYVAAQHLLVAGRHVERFFGDDHATRDAMLPHADPAQWSSMHLAVVEEILTTLRQASEPEPSDNEPNLRAENAELRGEIAALAAAARAFEGRTTAAIQALAAEVTELRKQLEAARSSVTAVPNARLPSGLGWPSRDSGQVKK